MEQKDPSLQKPSQPPAPVQAPAQHQPSSVTGGGTMASVAAAAAAAAAAATNPLQTPPFGVAPSQAIQGQGMRLSFDAPPPSLSQAPGAMFHADGAGAGVVRAPAPPAAGSKADGLPKKRGRPRKYAPDGSMALALSPFSPAGSAAGGGYSPATDPAHKRAARPPGSSAKKQQFQALGSWGIAFTPHVITVKAGEDVASKIMSFSQQGPRTVCVLSANGAISNVTLRQPATSGGLVTYEGRFEIISLSGSFLLAEDGDTRSRTGGLSVSLAGSDGRVLGGCVAGMLMAATPVQVVIGSFIAEGKKSKPDYQKREPLSAPPQMPPFPMPMIPLTTPHFGMAPGVTPPSDGSSSGSSDSDDDDSPVNHGGPAYNNLGQQHMQHVYAAPGGWSLSGHQNRHDSDMKMMSN